MRDLLSGGDVPRAQLEGRPRRTTNHSGVVAVTPLLSGGDVPRAALSGRPGAGQQITRVLLP